MSSVPRRIGAIATAVLLMGAANHSARAEQAPIPCEVKCEIAAISACTGNDATWCLYWIAGCELGCHMQ
jgi:hypothetical protein